MRKIDLRSEIAKHVILTLIVLTWISSAGLSQSLCPKSILDERDGKKYKTVQIGDQCWMAQNLNVGTIIATSANPANNAVIEKYCYNNSELQCSVYGGVYQWNEMMQYSTTPGIQGICPSGWHVPSDAEWSTLSSFLGGESVAGGKMKETDTTHWYYPNTGATNSSGFTGLPGGSRSPGGSFSSQSGSGEWWSSTLSPAYYNSDASYAWFRRLSCYHASVRRGHYIISGGYFVRCLKD